MCVLQFAPHCAKACHIHQPLTSEIVKHNCYVNDCLFSCESETEAIYKVHNLVKMLSRVGFQSRKWLSNNKKMLEVIPESERPKDFGCHESEFSLANKVLRVLRMYQNN